ncbi:hypothetical protein BDW69DRAFT_114764 [Aspergillus filifer]
MRTRMDEDIVECLAADDGFLVEREKVIGKVEGMQNSAVGISLFFYHILFGMVGHLQYGESLGLVETGSHKA